MGAAGERSHLRGAVTVDEPSKPESLPRDPYTRTVRLYVHNYFEDGELMSKRTKGISAGVGMVIVGVAMYAVFGHFIEVDTPIIGLQQVGAVVAAIGVIELVAVWWHSFDKRKKTSSGS